MKIKRYIKKIPSFIMANFRRTCYPRCQELTVFVYHFVTSKKIPFLTNSHNVTPEVFEQQIGYLKKKFKLIDLRNLHSFFDEPMYKKPLAAVSFDDNYACVFEEAYPILVKMEVPATIFVNSSTVGNRSLMWRDKIRYLLAQNLEGQFIDFLKESIHRRSYNQYSLKQIGLYRWSKDPISINSWEYLTKDLTKFFNSKNINESVLANQFNLYGSISQLEETKYLGFGNHTESHPPMVMLSKEKQKKEIIAGKLFLKKQGVQDVGLAIPFTPYNDDTINLCKEFEYRFVFSTYGYSVILPKQFNAAPLIVDRVLAPSDFTLFKKRILFRGNKIIDYS